MIIVVITSYPLALPVITEPTDMLQVRLTVGDSFTLRCQASGAPAPTVKVRIM